MVHWGTYWLKRVFLTLYVCRTHLQFFFEVWHETEPWIVQPVFNILWCTQVAYWAAYVSFKRKDDLSVSTSANVAPGRLIVLEGDWLFMGVIECSIRICDNNGSFENLCVWRLETLTPSSVGNYLNRERSHALCSMSRYVHPRTFDSIVGLVAAAFLAFL